MTLKRLEMQGFKSFPDKTSIVFDAGITAIVGPNGSGKSNISDAMRWVLGEASTKALRGVKMEDIIFNGSSARNSSAAAEVTIVFDNSLRTLNLPYEDVCITRRYSRLGDGGFYINGKSVRQKDIHELLMNTGAGREGYSIIGQGKISEILSTKSEERRGVFEEASGIAKYRYKKDESEKKLASVDDNLLRVNDILLEISSRIEPLAGEADKARKYLELYDRRRELEVTFWLDRVDTIRHTLEKSLLESEHVKNGLFLTESDIVSAENKLENLYEQTQRTIIKIDELREKSGHLVQKSSELRTKCDVQKNDIQHLQSLRENNEVSINATSTEHERLNSEIENKTLQIERIYNRYTHELSENSKTESLLDDITEKANCITQHMSSTQEISSAIKNEITAHNLALREKITLEQTHSQRLTAVKQSLDENQAKLKALSDENGEYVRQQEENLSHIADFREKYRKQNLHIQRLNGDISTKKSDAEKLRLQSIEITTRIDTLERMDKLFEGYNNSVKAVLKAGDRGGLSGIHGTISQLITSSPALSLAIETALGGSVQNIIVESEDNAKAAIDFLKRSGQGRATFYPLDVIKGGTIGENDLYSCKGYIGIASELAECAAQYRNIVENLLGRTIVAETLREASEIAHKYNYRYRVVTRDGQIINAGGSYTGGSSGSRSGLLTRKTDINKLSIQRAELEQNMAEASHEIAALEEEVQKYTANQTLLSQDIDQMETYRLEISTAIRLNQANSDNIAGQIVSLSDEYKKINSESDVYALDIAQLEEYINNRQDELTSIEKISESDGEKYNELMNKREAIVEKLNINKLLLQQILSEHTLEGERLANLLTARQKLSDDTSAKITDNIDIAARIEQICESCRQDELTVLKISDDLTSTNQLISNLETEQRAYEQTSAQLNLQIREKTSLREGYLREIDKYHSQKQTLDSEHDQLITRLWDEYELTYTTASQFRQIIAPSEIKHAHNTLNSLREQMRKLGSVNVNAIDEYSAVKQRHDFLNKQVTDLTQSKEKLNDIIRELEYKMQAEFSASISIINEYFREVFRELFDGGTADIVLTDENNVLQSGIDIRVQPPGKIIKNLMALSGGEQAFVAIALYLAILKLNPSPFCLLDEIDTALDEINVDRLAAYIRHHCSKTQFVMITHRRGTMEVANRLYGITMGEPGVSRFLTINVNEVEKRIGVKI